MVRTPGFHPGNPGSIPGEITKEKRSSVKDGRFSLLCFIVKSINTRDKRPFIAT